MSNLYARRSLDFDNMQEGAFSPQVMALTLQIFTRRFSLLIDELTLLEPDPLEFGDRK